MRFFSRSSPVSHPAANCLSRRWAYTLVERQLDGTGTGDWQPQQASGCAVRATPIPDSAVEVFAPISLAPTPRIGCVTWRRPAGLSRKLWQYRGREAVFRADDKSIGTTPYEQSTE